ncbi:electron transport complex subunit RsxG [Veronia nyctiphanis]|uniref:Ion-translocating oxidoreductase complex subunit G n=1 Tax=Veronia nyctiphanis TaxID=1278244 RepID=A0A4Q0YD22_9GAMM|nr:electron transport complex subunit RsxG [Veronia nyctiphanis]RXJ68336.1 electron transport complex subunit RsxG [Veronia nyctiphanis]
MIKAMGKNGVILAIAALAATGLVAVTNQLTADTIAQQQKAHLLKQLNQVIPESSHDNALSESCRLVSSPLLGSDESKPLYVASKGGNVTGMAVEAVAPDGYNGAIRILVAIDSGNRTTGVRVLNHNETPGLGDKIDTKVSDWILRFTGKNIESKDDPHWAVKKDGGQFDQFTGATITPRAVVKASRNAAWFMIENRQSILNQPLDCGAK